MARKKKPSRFVRQIDPRAFREYVQMTPEERREREIQHYQAAMKSWETPYKKAVLKFLETPEQKRHVKRLKDSVKRLRGSVNRRVS
jgi:hypothetical protein